MDYVSLGNTGLEVSVVGLGAGGPSRLGQKTGHSEAESVAVVRRALELGINFFDTAEAYGTEPILAQALAGVERSDVILSSKKSLSRDGVFVPPDRYAAGVEASLQRLQTDYIDIYHIHGLKVKEIEYARNEVLPMLLRLKEEGKIRFLAVSESFGSDSGHAMFQQLLAEDDVWDVVMVGFNMLNQSARERVFPLTRAKGIGTECMFAVRRALSRPERLREVIADLVEQGKIDAAEVDQDEPLGFVLAESDAASLTEAAYRFCRHEPGMDMVFTGTGNLDHLEENVHALLRPPLPETVVERVKRLFARVDSVAGN